MLIKIKGEGRDLGALLDAYGKGSDRLLKVKQIYEHCPKLLNSGIISGYIIILRKTLNAILGNVALECEQFLTSEKNLNIHEYAKKQAIDNKGSN